MESLLKRREAVGVEVAHGEAEQLASAVLTRRRVKDAVGRRDGDRQLVVYDRDHPRLLGDRLLEELHPKVDVAALVAGHRGEAVAEPRHHALLAKELEYLALPRQSDHSLDGDVVGDDP